MEKYYNVTIWTNDHKLTDMIFLNFENAMKFASEHKEEFYSISTEKFMDCLVK